MSSTVYFGANSPDFLKRILEQEKARKIFLVAGKGSYLASGAKSKLAPVLRGYEVVPFHNFSTDPKLEDICTGIELYRRNPTDITLAIGGGSSLDVAKAVTLLAEQEKDPTAYIKQELKAAGTSKPLIAVPTTAGSGSEATHFAVVYIGTTKYSLAHPCLLPHYAIIDSELTISLPASVTASTGMDALAQAMESLWCIHSTPESETYAREAINGVLQYLETAVHKPTHLEARENLSKAAHLAGKAINITKTTASHALSYPMSAHFGIPHGHAVALTLPEVVVFNAEVEDKDCLDKRGSSYVRRKMQELFALFEEETAEGVKRKLEHLMDSIGLERHLGKLVDNFEIDHEIIMREVNMERGQNNPRRLTKDALLKILRNIQ